MEPRWTRHLTALAASVAALLILTGCGEKPEDPPASEPAAAAVYAPELTTAIVADTATAIDAAGEQVTLLLSIETPSLNGVDASISDAFTTAFDREVSGFVAAVAESVAGHPAELLSCGTAKGCELPVDVRLPIAELFEDTVTLTLDPSALIGGTNRLSLPSSITLDLRTGKERQLAEFIDVTDEAAQRTVSAHGGNEMHKNPACSSGEARFELTDDAVWSPTADGLVLTFDERNAGLSRACGSLQITVPWPGADEVSAVRFPLSCEELMPPEEIGDTVKLSQVGDDMSIFDEARGYGPVAVEAFATATGAMTCYYHIPNSGFMMGFSIVDMPQSSRETLLAGLRESVYTEGTHTPAGGSPIPTFVWSTQAEYGPGATLSYAFVGDYVYTSPGGGETVLPTVAERLQRAAGS